MLQSSMDLRFSATVIGAAVAACTCSTENSGLISVIRSPFFVTSSTHISVMILVTQVSAVSGRVHFSAGGITGLGESTEYVDVTEAYTECAADIIVRR